MTTNALQGTPRVDALDALLTGDESDCYRRMEALARQLERELCEATMEGKIDGSPDDPLAQRCLDLERALANEQACTKAMNEDFHKQEERIQRLEGELIAMTDAYENMRNFARANGLDTTAAPSGIQREDK